MHSVVGWDSLNICLSFTNRVLGKDGVNRYFLSCIVLWEGIVLADSSFMHSVIGKRGRGVCVNIYFSFMYSVVA